MALQKADESTGLAEAESEGGAVVTSEAAENDRALTELQQMMKGVAVK